MIKVVRISEAPEFEEESGWSLNTPYQVHVLDGADPQVHADGRIFVQRCDYYNGSKVVVIRVPAKLQPFAGYILSTQAMDALARRVDPKARLTGSHRDNIGGSVLYRTYAIKD